MKIELSDVARIAALAALEFSDEELGAMRADLDRILGYVETLEALDTEGVPPTDHVLDIATPVREDRVERVLSVEEAVRNAPDHNEQAFVVPKVVE